MFTLSSKVSIIKKLEQHYDAHDLSRIIWYLSEEEKEYHESDQLSPAWKNLELLQNNPDTMKSLADCILDDIRQTDKDTAFYLTMNLIYTKMINKCKNPVNESKQHGWDLVELLDENDFNSMMAHNWALLSQSVQTQMIVSWEKERRDSQKVIMPAEKEEENCSLVLPKLLGTAVTVIKVIQSVASLAWVTFRNVYSWCKGDISGARCAKNIVDSTISTSACLLGEFTGTAFGAIVGGPIGAAVAGFIGGLAASHFARVLIDRLTRKLFALPNDVALENAYRLLGVSVNASYEEVKVAFRKECLRHHPDKGGNRKDFEALQNAMSIIRYSYIMNRDTWPQDGAPEKTVPKTLF